MTVTHMLTARSFVCVSFVIWLSAGIAGMTVLWNHEARPGIAAQAPSRWPQHSRLEHSPRVDGRPGSTMLVWIHPRCPCSWATIGELKRMQVHIPDDTDCQIILSRPPSCDEAFIESDLTRAIRRMEGVRIVVDEDQREAERFGVATSGQVLLYGKNDQLLYAGGITPGRGHEGDSVGAARLRDLFRAGPPRMPGSGEPSSSLTSADAPQCCVFGCGLFGPTRDHSESP